MEYTVEKLKQTLFENVFEVYDIFKNHFKEKYVDLQGLPLDQDFAYRLEYLHSIKKNDDGTFTVSDSALNTLKNVFSNIIIYVWWPKVTVTNEYNKSINIQDLYAKITINTNGCIPYECHGFLLNRAAYPAVQFDCNYLHSHISTIPKNNFTEFQTPCLGRGPIMHTITTLKSSNDSAMWMLFCEELSRYVTVESIKGVPYKRLENVGRNTLEYNYDKFSEYRDPLRTLHNYYYNQQSSAYYLTYKELRTKVKDFTAYYLKHGHLKLNYTQGEFTCGMNFFDFIVDISNCFIEYYNTALAIDKKKVKFLYKVKILNDVLAADGKIYKLGDGRSRHDHSSYQGATVLTFKGETISLKILENESTTAQKTTLIHWLMAQHILDSILNIINFRFTNENRRNTKGSTTPAETRKTVYYL